MSEERSSVAILKHATYTTQNRIRALHIEMTKESDRSTIGECVMLVCVLCGSAVMFALSHTTQKHTQTHT